MKKMFIIGLVMIGAMFHVYAQSPIISLGKAIGELAIAPVGIAVGVVEGVADGVCESVTYLVTGDTGSTSTTTVKTTTVTQTTAPVYVIPPKAPEKNEINIVNSPGAQVNVTEVKTTTQTTRTPTVIYVPSTRPSYYYYPPARYLYP